MNTYLFTVPLAEGKTEAWKKYMEEIKGPRFDEYKKSRQKIGLKTEQVFLQQTPQGDACVVMWETDHPEKVFEAFAKSEDAFDKWFREKVLIDAHGMDLSQPVPINHHALTYRETPAGVPA